MILEQADQALLQNGEDGLISAIVYPVFWGRSPPDKRGYKEIYDAIESYNRSVPLYKQIRKV